MRRLLRAAALVVAAVVVTAGPALAAWDATSSSARGVAAAAVLPAGGAPTSLVRLGRNVDVTWPQVDWRGTPLGAHPGGLYELSRSGSPAGGTCAGSLAPGGAASSTCRDSGLAPGSYAYAVTPGLHGWRGATSSPVTVTVPSPSLSLSPTTWGGPTAPLQGSIDAFLDGAPLTYRLGHPTTGAVLTGSLTTFPTAPAAPPATAVTVGCGPSTGPAHTVHAVSGGEQAAGTFTADFSAVLCPSSLATSAGLTPARAEAADSVSITFSRALDGGTACAGLAAGGSTPGSLRATVVDGGAADDTLVVTAPEPATPVGEACGSRAGVCVVVCVLGQPGAVRVGTLDLGSTGYAVGGDVVFGTGTALSLDSTGTVLTVTLGTSTSLTARTAVGAGAARYVPHPALRSAVGALPATGFQSSGGPLL